MSLPGRILEIQHLLGQRCGRGNPVRVLETSKSWIFIAPAHVYKLKKHVRDELQDLTTLRARFDNCLTEIDLNRRLAPQTYLGLIRVVRDKDGTLALDGLADTVDWLLVMRRLPADKMLDAVIARQPAQSVQIRSAVTRLGERLVAFYASCPVSRLNATELRAVLDDQQALNAACLRNPLFSEHHARLDAVCDAATVALSRHADLFAERVDGGWIRECHGDLRPEHICLTSPPIVFDCLEFNRNLRLVDPFSEVAFLGMEAEILGAGWIKAALTDQLAAGLETRPAPALLRLYEALHALLRTRLCLAHLLAPIPRTPQKWMAPGLRYLAVAEGILCGPQGLGR